MSHAKNTIRHEKDLYTPSVTLETLTVRGLLAASTVYIEKEFGDADASSSLSNRKGWGSENPWGNSGIWATEE